MQKLKVSVIVPIYNGEKYLRKCIDSILNQTYDNIEIVLVNDGSKDNTINICNEYKERYDNVVVVNQENGGVSSARNNGIKHASGEYIGFVDADDYIEDIMYEKMMNNMLNDEVDIVSCNLIYEDLEKNIIKEYYHADYIIDRKDFLYEMYHNLCMQGYACNKLYNKRLFGNEYNMFNESLTVLEDDLFNFYIFKKNKQFRVKYINERLYHYVQLNTSASNSKFNIKKLSYLRAREEEINILLEEKINCDYLKADYCAAYKRMLFLAKKQNIYDEKVFREYKKTNKIYMKSIDLNSLSMKEKKKYLIIKYLPFIYYLKIILNKEN